jgi:GT2 family glycosyltransferase
MELSSGPQPLALDHDGYRSLGVFFTLHGVPLGHKYFHAIELPLTAPQVWEVAIEAILPALTAELLPSETTGDSVRALAALHPLDAFRIAVENKQTHFSNASVSVVICTRERPAALARCLASLRNLADPPLEIIVVDNAPATDATAQVVAEFPNVRYKLEPRPGLSHARNAGIRASRGEVIAFTDDDVVVTENWLTELVRPFHDPAVACTTGLVIPAEMERTEQAFFESWLSFNRGYRPKRFTPEWLRSFRFSAPVWNLGAGASMALRRSVLADTGTFDTRLGAGAAGCSEDSELWYRILAAGYSCEYVPSSLVLHHHRADRESLARQMRLYSRGHIAALLIQFHRHGHFGNLLRAFGVLPLYYARKLGASLIFREWRPFWTASTTGYLSGFFYLAGHPKDRSREALAEKPKAAAALTVGEPDADR